MPARTEISNAGMPVELDAIERELKKLWEQSSGAAARASLVNLAIYSEEADSLSSNTRIISTITEEHACRALVIQADRSKKENHVEAWISAHCHVSGTGGKQVCSEQVSFALEGPCVGLLPSVVFSHLDSDLPFYLWWQGEFHDPMDAQLWSWVDRLIYDSQPWTDFREQMRLVETAQEEAKQRVVLCDLNWTRLVSIRFALAQFFDHPASHHHLAEITDIEIDFAPGYRSTAILLSGWMAAQLQWKFVAEKKITLQFQAASAETIEVKLKEKAGESIGRCAVHCRNAEFRVSHEEEADVLEVSCRSSTQQRAPQLMPAAAKGAVALISEELMRGGPHQVYLRALNCVRELF